MLRIRRDAVFGSRRNRRSDCWARSESAKVKVAFDQGAVMDDRRLLAFIEGQENATVQKHVDSYGTVDLRQPHHQNPDFRRHRRLSHQEEGKAMSVNIASFAR